MSKKIDIVRLKALSMVKEGEISYLEENISTPENCYSLIKKYIDEVDREVFIVMALDTKNKPTAIQTVSVGTLNTSLVHPREVYKMALMSNAASIIVSHNHPSGNPEPSSEDKVISNRLKKAGEVLGIKLLDHIIIGDYTYFSFKEKNKL